MRELGRGVEGMLQTSFSLLSLFFRVDEWVVGGFGTEASPSVLTKGLAKQFYNIFLFVWDNRQTLTYWNMIARTLMVAFDLCACRNWFWFFFHVHNYSISCLNVKYPFPVFPHSVSDLWITRLWRNSARTDWDLLSKLVQLAFY